MRIENLSENPALIPVVARWIYDEWRHLIPQDSLEAWTRHFTDRLCRRRIATTFLAFNQKDPAGSASLVAHDLDIRENLSPWLAEVYVRPEYRQRGIGSALVQRVVREAEVLDVQTLYLYTFDREAFYERLGWAVMEQTEYRGKPITIMRYEFGA